MFRLPARWLVWNALGSRTSSTSAPFDCSARSSSNASGRSACFKVSSSVARFSRFSFASYAKYAGAGGWSVVASFTNCALVIGISIKFVARCAPIVE